MGRFDQRTFRKVVDFQGRRRLSRTPFTCTHQREGAFALHEVLKLAVDYFPQTLKGATLVVDVDNQTMHGAFRRGRGKNADMHGIIKKITLAASGVRFHPQTMMGLLRGQQRRRRLHTTGGCRTRLPNEIRVQPSLARMGRFGYGALGYRHFITFGPRVSSWRGALPASIYLAISHSRHCRRRRTHLERRHTSGYRTRMLRLLFLTSVHGGYNPFAHPDMSSPSG